MSAIAAVKSKLDAEGVFLIELCTCSTSLSARWRTCNTILSAGEHTAVVDRSCKPRGAEKAALVSLNKQQ